VAFSFVGILTGIVSVNQRAAPSINKVAFLYLLAAAIFVVVPVVVGKKKTLVDLAWAWLAFCSVLLVMCWIMPNPNLVRETGAHRWASAFGVSLMPIDLLKPAFIILAAWFISSCRRIATEDWIADKALWASGRWPAFLAAFGAFLACMFIQPDLGNMFMYILTFSAMAFVVGIKWRYVFGGAAALTATIAAASITHSHFRMRLMGVADDWQATQSKIAIRNGGLWGQRADSFVFGQVPMANNDFVFSEIAEMWGVVAGAALIAAMFWMFIMLIRRANQAKDDFSMLVIFGVAFMFALHVMMNIFTAIGLFMKGTTLPFISYGGSSLIAFSLMFAAALALARIDKWGK